MREQYTDDELEEMLRPYKMRRKYRRRKNVKLDILDNSNDIATVVGLGGKQLDETNNDINDTSIVNMDRTFVENNLEIILNEASYKCWHWQHPLTKDWSKAFVSGKLAKDDARQALGSDLVFKTVQGSIVERRWKRE